MLDFGAKWRPLPDWDALRLEGQNVEATAVTNLHEILVSGDLGRALDALADGITPSGAADIARGDPYALRLGRERLLLVGTDDWAAAPGWHGDGGFAVTPFPGGDVVFEITGRRAADLLAAGLNHPLEDRRGSVLSRFADVTVALYRYGQPETWRIHVERPLAGYLWHWLETQLACGAVR